MKLLLTICLLLLGTFAYGQTIGNVVRDVQGAPYAVFRCTASEPILKWDATLDPPRFKCQADSGGTDSITVADDDTNPSYTGITEIRFDQSDGFVITNPSAGIAQIDLSLTDNVGYDEILDEASGLTKRAKLNFIGSLVTCADDAGNSRTNCTFLGDGVGYDEVLNEASGLTKRAKINFTGDGVNCVDNSGSSRTDCTISGDTTVPPVSQQYPRHFCYLGHGVGNGTLYTIGCPFDDTGAVMAATGNTPSLTYTGRIYHNKATAQASGSSAGWDSRQNTTTDATFRHRFTMRMVVAVVDSAGTDSTKYRFTGGMIEAGTGTGVMALTTCATGNATWNGSASVDAFYYCWEKANQANILICGGNTSTTTRHCTDTGIAAPASDTYVDLFLDYRTDGTITGTIDGVAVGSNETTQTPTFSTDTPTAPQIFITNSALTSGASAIIIKARHMEWSFD